jgi:arylsulfatase A-like enzyme
LLAAACALSASAAEKPNIVLILADDLGYGSVNSYGAPERLVRTPAIDRLAREGRRFTNANTPSSVCSPTRYAVLTGRYDWRTSTKHGVLNTTAPLHIETDRLTLSSMLKEHGYRCAAIGKWHLGYGTGKADFTGPLKPGPLELGFDYHFAVPQNHGDASGVYVENHGVLGLRSRRLEPFGKTHYGRAFMGIDAPQRKNEEVMSLLTDKAVAWLRQQEPGRPFFLFFTPVAVHEPCTPSEKTKGTSGTGAYGDWIHELDRSVGRILDCLDRQKLSDNTLVIFTSDNGGVLLTSGPRPAAEAYAAGLRVNGHWRGRKHSIYEGGFRVPFLVRWPGKVAAGSVCRQMINLVDMVGSVAALVGHPLPPADEGAEDTCNVLPALLGESKGQALRETMVLTNVDGTFAIRHGPWKYVEGKASPTARRVMRKAELTRQLYHLADDPGESNNLIDTHRQQAAKLAAMLDQIRRAGHSRP